MTKKKAPPPPPPRFSFHLNPELWKQLVSLALLALSVVILLSMLSGNRGSVTDALITGLSLLVGRGIALAPIWFGALGVYLLLDSLNKLPNIGLERPLGAAILYIVALALLHLIVRGLTTLQDPELAMQGGGWVGEGLGTLLSNAIGEAGAYVILIAFGMAGMILLLNVSLGQLAQNIGHLAARTRGEELMPGVKINTGATRAGNTSPLSQAPRPEPQGRRNKEIAEPPPPKPTKEKKSTVVVGRAEAPQPPLPPMVPRIIGRRTTTGLYPTPIRCSKPISSRN